MNDFAHPRRFRIFLFESPPLVPAAEFKQYDWEQLCDHGYPLEVQNLVVQKRDRLLEVQIADGILEYPLDSIFILFEATRTFNQNLEELWGEAVHTTSCSDDRRV